MSKSYLELTEEEIDRLAILTPKERSAVDNFIAAAKALPKTICISLEDFEHVELHVSKRITRGSAQGVAVLRKKSLAF